MQRIIFLATSFGPKHGGLNAFNMNLCTAVAGSKNLGEVICVVPTAEQDVRLKAKELDVRILVTGTEALSGLAVRAALRDAGLLETADWWVGHDQITGPCAIECRSMMGGRAALIHHMNYGAYISQKTNGRISPIERERPQRELFGQADEIFAVGPLLRDSLRQLLPDRRDRCHMMIPGLELAESSDFTSPLPFRAVIFGRMGGEDEPIKLGRLAIAAFSHAYGEALRLCKDHPGYRNHLTTKRPVIKVIGVPKLSKIHTDLQDLAKKYAGGMTPLVDLQDFIEDRDELKWSLQRAHIAIMPSWHEGFGLAGWEAIEAGIPLVLSRQSGLYDFVQGEGEHWASDLASFDVDGQFSLETGDESFTDDDVHRLSSSILQMGANYAEWKARCNRLGTHLARYSWKACADIFVKNLGLEVNAEVVKISEHPIGAKLDLNEKDFGRMKADLSDQIAAAAKILACIELLEASGKKILNLFSNKCDVIFETYGSHYVYDVLILRRRYVEFKGDDRTLIIFDKGRRDIDDFILSAAALNESVRALIEREKRVPIVENLRLPAKVFSENMDVYLSPILKEISPWMPANYAASTLGKWLSVSGELEVELTPLNVAKRADLSLFDFLFNADTVRPAQDVHGTFWDWRFSAWIAYRARCCAQFAIAEHASRFVGGLYWMHVPLNKAYVDMDEAAQKRVNDREEEDWERSRYENDDDDTDSAAEEQHEPTEDDLVESYERDFGRLFDAQEREGLHTTGNSVLEAISLSLRAALDVDAFFERGDIFSPADEKLLRRCFLEVVGCPDEKKYHAVDRMFPRDSVLIALPDRVDAATHEIE